MPRKKQLTPPSDVEIAGSLGHGKKSTLNADLSVGALLDGTRGQLFVTGKPQPTLRRASRLILFDDQQRVLLFRHAGVNGKAFWAPPGGGLEDSETFEQAAQREACEELGVTGFTPKRLWEREADFVYVDHPVHQHEWFFLVEGGLPTISGSVETIHSEEGILEMRWWTVAEIESTADPVFPEGLAKELGKISK